MEIFIKNLFEKYRFNSILFVNFYRIFFTMFAILCVSCIVIYSSLMRISKNEMLLYHETNAKNMIQTTESVMNEMKNLTLNIAIDTDVRNYIMSERVEEFLPGYQSKLYTKLASYKSMTQYVYSVYLYNEAIDRIISHQTENMANAFADNSWLEFYKEHAHDTMYVAPNKVMGNYPYVLTYISSVAGKGCVAVSVDIYEIAKKANRVFNGKYNLYMVDENNIILYANDENKFMTELDTSLYTQIEESRDGIFHMKEDTYYGYCVEEGDKKNIITVQINEYTDKVRITRWMLIFAMVLTFLIGMFIAGRLALNSFEPISKLTHFVDEPNANDLADVFKNNEAKYIAMKILSYIDSNSELKRELNARLNEHNQLSMMAMQMQINPHFLNNSLNVIGLKLAKELGAENNTTVMVTSLARLIQYILNFDTIFVDFKQEFSFLKNYIEFLDYRYQDLHVTWDIEAEVYRYKIIRVCLQPFVENAVYHGLAALDGEKHLRISAKVREDKIIIAIEDNGIGMDAEKHSSVLQQMKSEELLSRHIGIKNVYRRLKIVYGEQADIKIDSVINQYTSVTIIIPTEL